MVDFSDFSAPELVKMLGSRFKDYRLNETGKLHTQTLAAMDPEADGYEKLFAVCSNCIYQKWIVRNSIDAWCLTSLPTILMTTTRTSRL